MLRCTLPLPLILLLNVAVARLLYELVEEILALPGQDGLHSLIQDVLASTGTAENATITLETSVDVDRIRQLGDDISAHTRERSFALRLSSYLLGGAMDHWLCRPTTAHAVAALDAYWRQHLNTSQPIGSGSDAVVFPLAHNASRAVKVYPAGCALPWATPGSGARRGWISSLVPRVAQLSGDAWFDFARGKRSPSFAFAVGRAMQASGLSIAHHAFAYAHADGETHAPTAALLVMDRGDVTLGRWLARTPPPSRQERQRTLVAVSDTLSELHKQGWFHGDAHEENVVLVGDQWVLQDWDWAHRGGEGNVCSRKASWDPALPFCNLLRPHRRIHGPNEELVIRYLTSRIFRDSSPEESRQAY